MKVGTCRQTNQTDILVYYIFFDIHIQDSLYKTYCRGNTYQYVYSYSGEKGPGHSAEIPLFWATHKGKRWIKTKEELGESAREFSHSEIQKWVSE